MYKPYIKLEMLSLINVTWKNVLPRRNTDLEQADVFYYLCKLCKINSQAVTDSFICIYHILVLLSVAHRLCRLYEWAQDGTAMSEFAAGICYIQGPTGYKAVWAKLCVLSGWTPVVQSCQKQTWSLFENHLCWTVQSWRVSAVAQPCLETADLPSLTCSSG